MTITFVIPRIGGLPATAQALYGRQESLPLTKESIKNGKVIDSPVVNHTKMLTTMKKYFTISLLALLTFAADAFGQKNAIKLNLLSPIVMTASLSYERAFNDEYAMQLGFFYTGFSTSDTEFRGFGITPEYRFYLSESPAPRGFYVAPFVRYQDFDLTLDNEEGKGSYSSIGGGLMIGKQWLFKERVTLDMFIGPKYSVGDVKVESGNENDFELGIFNGFGVRAGLTLGLAF